MTAGDEQSEGFVAEDTNANCGDGLNKVVEAEGDSDDSATASSSSDMRSNQRGCCHRGLSRIGCLCVYHIPEKWPRTCGLVFGVIMPLFLLIGVSIFFGHYLAKFEAPGEIEQNNQVIATRYGFDLMRGFSTDVTIRLPHMCTLIYMNMSDHKENGRIDARKIDHNQTLLEKMLEVEIERIFSRTYDHIAQEWYDSLLNESPPADVPDEDVTDANAYMAANATDATNTMAANATEDDDAYLTVTSEVDGTFVADAQDMLAFTQICGEEAWKVEQKVSGALLGVADLDYLGDDVSFNWIRCGEAVQTSNCTLCNLWEDLWDSFKDVMKPDQQVAFVMNEWKKQQIELYRKYLNESLEEGNRLFDARVEALARSYEEANGFEQCEENKSAAAWFWFTVMTTIGYGNTAPASVGGRAMIYTLGFFSILLFAAILSRAGTVVTTIFDDWAERMRLSLLGRPSVAMVFWGSLYYGWMVIIASFTQYWKQDRLGESMDFKDAFWFSYISTTTVGLGDYFLEHGVILRQDLLSFPLLFLFGFVLLANFLVKLTELVLALFPQNRPTLEDNLKASNPPCCPRLPKMMTPKMMTKRKKDTDKMMLKREEEIEDEYEYQEEVPKDVPEEASTIEKSASVDVEGGWRGVVSSSRADRPQSVETEPTQNVPPEATEQGLQ